jgi:hypothetical protein
VPLVLRRVVKQQEIEREGFLNDAFVVLTLRKGPIGLGEKHAVPWFGWIEGRIVDDYRERERFSSQERKIAEQSGDTGAEREDPHTVGSLLHRYGDRGQAAAEHRDRGSLPTGELFGISRGH